MLLNRCDDSEMLYLLTVHCGKSGMSVAIDISFLTLIIHGWGNEQSLAVISPSRRVLIGPGCQQVWTLFVSEHFKAVYGTHTARTSIAVTWRGRK